jgi:DNA-binding NarL/FixJ family response regulator
MESEVQRRVIATAQQGTQRFCPDVNRRDLDTHRALTNRERDVLRLMAAGRSNAGIGAELFLSEKTVETHAAALFIKLGLYASRVDNRRVLAVLAFLSGSL